MIPEKQVSVVVHTLYESQGYKLAVLFCFVLSSFIPSFHKANLGKSLEKTMAVSQHELYKLSATQAAGLIRTNQLSAQDYAKALLDRVRERDPQVRAWAYLDENAILRQARKLDALPPEKRGPLHGIAVGIKDIFLTRGTCLLAAPNSWGRSSMLTLA